MPGGRADGRNGHPRGALREVLVAVAVEMVDEGGAAAVSVREVARRAGVSSGAPFRHFADRDALLEAAAEAVAAHFFETQVRAAEEATGLRFRAVGLGVVGYAVTYPHRFELLRSMLNGGPRSPLLNRASAMFDAFTAELVDAGRESGELRDQDPALVRLAGHALAYGLAQMTIDGYLPRDDAERLSAQVLDLLGEGIMTPPGPPSGGHDGIS
ncbi:TetR family transcriptional regulator [Thermomonospora umbrina]|uniref:TetR family transcriptional regulator n=1 Tax=Thermomonospora umbrina TaxID=111806 RepID=A0A3D9T3N8_9ACTN|nr:TetR family transcriptional regulator [Thermomonospora umbrina]